jgi:ribosome maturation factor RimP
MLKDLKTDIEKLLEPILGQEGFDLVEIKLSRYKKNFRLQIFVDSDHGVTLDECSHLSRLVGTALDTDDMIESRYILEVSSPGLDRPLQSDRDFRRKIGKMIELDFHEGGQDRICTGTITGVEKDILHLSGENGEIKVSLADVRQGKIIIKAERN